MHPVVRWLQSRMAFPLLAVSIVALTLFELWPVLIGPWSGPRLRLNLFLAWMPYWLALAAVALHQQLPRHPWLFRGAALAWLAFFPNAPYLITDWLYLPHWQSHLWFSIILLTSFTVCGLLLAVVSLYLMHTVVTFRAGPALGRCVCVTALVLAGTGVYLGRFIRLNSWDLLTRPRAVVDDALAALHAEPNHLGLVGFSFFFMLLLGGTYYAIVDLRRANQSREEIGAWGPHPQVPLSSVRHEHAESDDR